MELADYMVPGRKVEMQDIGKDNSDDAADAILEVKRIYISQVSELLPEGRIEIAMPMEKTKLVLLPLGGKYDTYFYTPKGICQGYVEVVDRYKKDNMYMLAIELTSKLQKVQRREYYRYSCSMEVQVRYLEPTEKIAFEKKERLFIPDLPTQSAVMADISGGGIRFISEEDYERDDFLYCTYEIVVNGKIKEYNHISRVLEIKDTETQDKTFQYRVQFYSITKQEREEIIKFIFDEERKNRQREKW